MTTRRRGDYKGGVSFGFYDKVRASGSYIYEATNKTKMCMNDQGMVVQASKQSVYVR